MAIMVYNQQNSKIVDISRLKRSVLWVLDQINCKNADLNVILVDDNEIKKINKLYRNVDKATNVLSFSMQEGEFGNVNPDILGDIIISTDTATKDAQEGNLELMDEIEFLVIHGILHLLGYDHENTSIEQTKKMERLERDLFFNLRGYHLD